MCKIFTCVDQKVLLLLHSLCLQIQDCWVIFFACLGLIGDKIDKTNVIIINRDLNTYYEERIPFSQYFFHYRVLRHIQMM